MSGDAWQATLQARLTAVSVGLGTLSKVLDQAEGTSPAQDQAVELTELYRELESFLEHFPSSEAVGVVLQPGLR